MAKIAAAVRPGFRLQPATVRDRTMQTVYAVTLDTAESVSIITEEGLAHSFGISEPVVFPRRPDGSHRVINVYEDVQVSIDDIFPGDLIRPLNHPVHKELELHEAWLVRTIYNIGDAGWTVYVSTDAGDGRSVSFIIPKSNALSIYTDGTSILPPAKEDQKKAPRASGWYLDTTKDEQVRFRLPGIIGRPPTKSRQAMVPEAVAWWAQFELLDGETPHPSDPRFAEFEERKRHYGDVSPTDYQPPVNPIA